MRSIGSTLILALLAILTLGVATWHWVGGNFDSVFGTPPTARLEHGFTSAGGKLYVHAGFDGSGELRGPSQLLSLRYQNRGFGGCQQDTNRLFD